MDLSIFCTLSTTEFQERKTTILPSLRSALLRRTRIPEGYRYQFASHPTTLQDVARLVELERFLNFAVTEGEKIVQLDVTGQPAALAIIEDLFG